MSEIIDHLMERAAMAAAEFSQFGQKETDRITDAVFEAVFDARVRLAKMAAEETGIGRWEDKVIKNVVGSQLVYEDIRYQKTVGIISEDHDTGIMEIAQPMGPVLAIIPVTNPTSTTMFKILICLKTRNPLIICPSKKAVRSCAETARICYEAALQAGAPEDCIQWIEQVTREQTQELMAHPKLSLILATGGTGLVKSAYSSGTPTLGVGAGNVPVMIEKSADIPFSVEQILISKTFDYGTICASEQAVVVERAVVPDFIREMQSRGGYFLKDDEVQRVTSIATADGGNMNPDIVGKPAVHIAKQAGIDVPNDTELLIAPLKGTGRDFPLSGEVLAPLLAFYTAESFEEGINICLDLNYYGGIGHSAAIYSNDDNKIKYFAHQLNAGRIVVNTPSSHGGVGGTFNCLNPSLTLGCGTSGKNITTDNVSARHLLNIQRIARRRLNERFWRFDHNKYLDESLSAREIQKIYNRNY